MTAGNSPAVIAVVLSDLLDQAQDVDFRHVSPDANASIGF
jgi:hypothetical protein